MKHKLKINVANESPKNDVVACKRKTIKRSLFKKLFGFNPDRITIIVPGDSVKTVNVGLSFK